MNRLLIALASTATLFGCTLGIKTCSSNAECGTGATCDLQAGVCAQTYAGATGGGIGAGGGFTGSGGGTQGGGGGNAGTGGGIAGTGGGTAGTGGGTAGTGGGTAGTGGGTAGTGGGTAGAGGGAAPATVISILVPALPARPASGGATYEDVPNAWRRNESIYVAVQSSRPLTNPQLTVGGSAAQPSATSSCTVACTGNCACFRVDLWLPPLTALRGTFMLAASGKDSAGATVTAAETLPVTRFSWSRTVVSGHQIRATPALGGDGTLYVGTSAGAALRVGSLVAIAPTGLERWNKPLGRIEGTAALSAPGSNQRIYVGAVDPAGGRLYAFNTAGVQQGQCILSPASVLDASPTVLTGGGAAFYSNTARGLVLLNPGSGCVSRSTGFDVPFPGNLVADGDTVYLADTQPRLRRFSLERDDDESEWKERTSGGWPAILPATFVARAIALVGSSKLVGAGSLASGGALFQASVGGGTQFDFGVPAPAASPAYQSPVIASGGAALAGVPAGLASVTSSGAVTGAGDPLRSAPVLGQGGRLFALSETGSISEWSSAGTPARSWTGPLAPGPAPAFEASPTLDCSRDPAGAIVAGRPGMLYAASRAGTLFAVIVDSRGLDTSAPWPKYQRDPRNTGNASTSLSEFSCP